MKKVMMNFKTLGVVAVLTAAFAISGCNSAAKCTEDRDDNYNSTTNDCNETATLAKFLGNWTGNPGAYPFNVTAGTDYKINVSTNFGLTDGANQLTPANLNGWSVSQNQASLASATLYNGNLTNATVSFTNSTSMTVTYTLSNFGSGVDGTYTEALSM
ncbi:MAG: hypothetical protein IAE67_09860 [Candidatus Competibacteraceae bacterium]|nr:hypothetical protein [Candidatus Competibacteraceae bacterium]